MSAFRRPASAPVPGGTVETAAPAGLHLVEVERWCAAMREAGAEDAAPACGMIIPSERDPAGPGMLTRLSGWPRATHGPVPVRRDSRR